MTYLAATSEDGGTFGDPAAVSGEQAHDIFRGDDAWLLRQMSLDQTGTQACRAP